MIIIIILKIIKLIINSCCFISLLLFTFKDVNEVLFFGCGPQDDDAHFKTFMQYLQIITN